MVLTNADKVVEEVSRMTSWTTLQEGVEKGAQEQWRADGQTRVGR